MNSKLILTGVAVLVVVAATFAWLRTSASTEAISTTTGNTVLPESTYFPPEMGAKQVATPAMIRQTLTSVDIPVPISTSSARQLRELATKTVSAYVTGDVEYFLAALATSQLTPAERWLQAKGPEHFRILTQTTADATFFPDRVRFERVEGSWRRTDDLGVLLGSDLNRSLKIGRVSAARSDRDPFNALPDSVETLELVIPCTMKYSESTPLYGELRVRFTRKLGEETWYPMMTRILQYNHNDRGDNSALSPPVE